MTPQEVLAKTTHIATHGTMQECFQDVANVLSYGQDFKVSVGGKSVRDRYGRMKRRFESAIKQKGMHSRTDEKVREKKIDFIQTRRSR